MSKFIDLTGQRFGRLIVISQEPSRKLDKGHSVSMWLCRCDCGNQKIIRSDSLRSGRTNSCGCLHKEQLLARTTRHGMTGSRLYITWQNMKDRCFNEKCSGYKDYGGRGISVCSEWKDSFENFYEWSLLNGYTDSLTIDRIDVNRNYEPQNCRWTTREAQNRNKRNNHYLTYNGITKTISEWAADIGMDYDTLHARIKYYGWTVEQALITPVRH